MSETNEIVAKVTEPKREPRPTLYGAAHHDGCWLFFGGFGTKSAAELGQPDDAIYFVVPGELESAQAARIEQARDAVIDAAVAHKHAEIHTVDRTPSFANLCDAIADLKALTTQENANG